MGELILTIYTLYDVFLCKELPFGVAMIASCIKIFSGIYFFNRD